jgi:hypothetical protein
VLTPENTHLLGASVSGSTREGRAPPEETGLTNPGIRPKEQAGTLLVGFLLLHV